MEELFNLAGKYNLNLSFNEEDKEIYASSKTAKSILVEDLEKIRELTGAEKAELYPEPLSEKENILIILPIPSE